MGRSRLILVTLVVLVGLALVATTSMAKQQVVKMIEKKDLVEYTIVPGDTLWDISDSYYNDPWLWPKIWELNTYIADPHWIYPENKLKISVSEAYKQVFWKQTGVDMPPVILFDPTFRYDTRENRIDIISPEKIKASGKIVDHIDDKLLISEYDTVYFTMSKKQNIQIGDIFTIYRIDEKVRHPSKYKKLGYLVNLIGEIETVEAHVLKNGKIVYGGKLLDSSAEISVGDGLIPYSRQEVTITIEESSLDLSGYIVENMESRTIISQHDICFIDLGIKQGVKRGQSFSIYRHSKNDRKLPPYFIGNVIVLKAGDTVSTVLITNSLREIAIGDMIRSDITTELN
jgi:LysM domain